MPKETLCGLFWLGTRRISLAPCPEAAAKQCPLHATSNAEKVHSIMVSSGRSVKNSEMEAATERGAHDPKHLCTCVCCMGSAHTSPGPTAFAPRNEHTALAARKAMGRLSWVALGSEADEKAPIPCRPQRRQATWKAAEPSTFVLAELYRKAGVEAGTHKAEPFSHAQQTCEPRFFRLACACD